MQETLKKLEEALKNVSNNVFHYYAYKQPDSYIVWAEENEENPLYADNYKNERVIVGFIELYTKAEYDPTVDTLQEALTKNGVTHRLTAVEYIEETEYIHYGFEFKAVFCRG